jgi:hypothetical protein
MEIVEVTPKEFIEAFAVPYYIYGSVSFNELNRIKSQSVHYLLFRNTKNRLGLIAGIKDSCIYSPFSAPFGGFIYLHNDIRIRDIDEAIDQFIIWTGKKSVRRICITLPPSIYNESFIAKQVNSLFRKNFTISKLDLNYSFQLTGFNDGYLNNIWYNARKNLKIAFLKNLNFSECADYEDRKLIYEIIRKNREIRNFPLKMTWEDVEETSNIVPADFFMIKTSESIPIASAIVFHISPEIVQVIYWGDLPEFSDSKTMNFLSYKLFEHYKLSGKKIIDTGPSTDNSIPNYGLCEFKESIGCTISQKLSLLLNLKNVHS